MSRLTNALLITVCLLLCLSIWLQLERPANAQQEFGRGGTVRILVVDSRGQPVGKDNPLPIQIVGRDPLEIDLSQVGGSRVWGGNGIPINIEEVDSGATFRTKQQ